MNMCESNCTPQQVYQFAHWPAFSTSNIKSTKHWTIEFGPNQGSFVAPILALLALFKGLQNIGFGGKSQGFVKVQEGELEFMPCQGCLEF